MTAAGKGEEPPSFRGLSSRLCGCDRQPQRRVATKLSDGDGEDLARLQAGVNTLCHVVRSFSAFLSFFCPSWCWLIGLLAVVDIRYQAVRWVGEELTKVIYFFSDSRQEAADGSLRVFRFSLRDYSDRLSRPKGKLTLQFTSLPNGYSMETSLPDFEF